jgi:O-methyltransferase
LFDTFEGFDKRDESEDRERGFISEVDNFSDTSVNLVLKKMRHPENCIVKKGFFPETAAGLSEKYAFVSIDCDLYKPILAGLEYFWEHLENGGYIFVHDYQNSAYSGVKAAVREFCGRNNIPYFLMSDIWGSVCLAKSCQG